MSRQNKELVTRFLGYMDSGDLAGMASCLSPDVRLHTKGFGAVSGVLQGNEVTEAYSLIKGVFPTGVNIKILDIIAEDGRVAVEWEGNAILSNGASYANQYAMTFLVENERITMINEYLCTKLADTVMMPVVSAMR